MESPVLRVGVRKHNRSRGCGWVHHNTRLWDVWKSGVSFAPDYVQFFVHSCRILRLCSISFLLLSQTIYYRLQPYYRHFPALTLQSLYYTSLTHAVKFPFVNFFATQNSTKAYVSSFHPWSMSRSQPHKPRPHLPVSVRSCVGYSATRTRTLWRMILVVVGIVFVLKGTRVKCCFVYLWVSGLRNGLAAGRVGSHRSDKKCEFRGFDAHVVFGFVRI